MAKAGRTGGLILSLGYSGQENDAILEICVGFALVRGFNMEATGQGLAICLLFILVLYNV